MIWLRYCRELDWIYLVTAAFFVSSTAFSNPRIALSASSPTEPSASLGCSGKRARRSPLTVRNFSTMSDTVDDSPDEVASTKLRLCFFLPGYILEGIRDCTRSANPYRILIGRRPWS
ncbi:hypothetical protein F4803DRAFT_544144 [Xylaria telfairii]|nr:hypothetical protein F4803DRAFT_544144 [Xylaria telfairii]